MSSDIEFDPTEFPRARQEGLIIRTLDDEVLVYDRSSDKASCLNAFAAEVWALCDGESSPGEIARAIAVTHRRAVEEDAVWVALHQLDRSGLLQAPVRMPASLVRSASRRDVMKRLGIGAALAVPAVTTMTAPTLAQGVSCLGDGAACTVNEQCCSFNCNTGVCGPALAAPPA